MQIVVVINSLRQSLIWENLLIMWDPDVPWISFVNNTTECSKCPSVTKCRSVISVALVITRSKIWVHNIMSLFPLASLPLILLCHGGGYGDPGYPNIFNPPDIFLSSAHAYTQCAVVKPPTKSYRFCHYALRSLPQTRRLFHNVLTAPYTISSYHIICKYTVVLWQIIR